MARNKRESETSDIEGPQQLEFSSFRNMPGKRTEDQETAKKRSRRPRRVVHVDTTREKKFWPLAWSVMRIIRGGLNTPKTYVPRDEGGTLSFERIVRRSEREQGNNSGIVRIEDKDALPSNHTLKPADAERMRQAFPERFKRNKRQ